MTWNLETTNPGDADVQSVGSGQGTERADDGTAAAEPCTVQEQLESSTEASLASELRELRDVVRTSETERAVLAAELEKTGDAYRCLKEQFYEREVLAPVVRRLLEIIDRREDDMRRLRRAWRWHARRGRYELADQLRNLLHLARADLTDLRSAIALFGVEPFCNPSSQFAPDVQECVQVVRTDDPVLEGLIARRIRPGYRRHGRVFRRERVMVYVKNSLCRNNRLGG